MKKINGIFLLMLIALSVLFSTAFQNETPLPQGAEPVSEIQPMTANTESVQSSTDTAASADSASEQNKGLMTNPLTGETTEDPDSLLTPPVFVPYSRYPYKNRPSVGISFAAWVFEMYASGEESRPFAMFYGKMPADPNNSPDAAIGAVGAALPGTEELRKQYNGIIITTGNPENVEDEGLLNNIHWYGTSGKDLYPSLPLSKLNEIVAKWKKLVTPIDVGAIKQNFSEAVPAGGLPGTSVFIKYAESNKIIWEYDSVSRTYRRSQNSFENPVPTADIDSLTGGQISVDNVVFMFATSKFSYDGTNSTVIFNNVKRRPALLFRDGQVFNIYWTSQNEKYEFTTFRTRPFRFTDVDGNLFAFKPGNTWVHILDDGNPYYEISDTTGDEHAAGSGHWKIPYMSPKP